MIRDAKEVNYKLMKHVGGMPTLKKRKTEARVFIDNEQGENLKLLDMFRNDYDKLYDLRKRRRRARNYYRGRQWSDIIEVNGVQMTEEQHIKDQGNIPLKQNQIRQHVKAVLGQYQNNPSRAQVLARSRSDQMVGEMMSNALQYAGQINQLKQLDTRSLEEHLMSGTTIQKVSYKYWKERDMEDVFVRPVNINNICFNTDLTDPRINQIRRVCEIMDLTLDEVIAAFARSKKEETKIRQAYSDVQRNDYLTQTFDDYGLSASNKDQMTFYYPNDRSKARVYECWFQQSEWRTYVHDYADGSYTVTNMSMQDIANINRQRIDLAAQDNIPEEQVLLMDAEPRYEQYWYVKYLTPNGICLYEGETVYEHQEHPFIIHLYPLVDGEVWGFVEDIIDQQKYINRLIILMDFIISSSAKGVLMIPENMIPDEMSPEDFAVEWTKFNGVITYKPDPKNPNAVPQQIAANSTNVGIQEMLSMQMQYLQDISGVHGAMQGAEAKSGTPSSLYAQMAQNASVNIMDIMESFNFFKQKRDIKMLKVIKQFYKEDRYLNIAGQDYSKEAATYMPEKVQNVDFDLTISQGYDTAIYRQIQDELLSNLFQSQAISVEMLLKHSSHPGADKLLRDIEAQKEKAAQQGGQTGGVQIPPELEQAAKEGDPKAKEMLAQFTGMPQNSKQQAA